MSKAKLVITAVVQEGRPQAEVARRWHAATPETITTLADTGWFRAQFRGLYGFDVPGIDYAQPVEADIPWPGEEAPGEQP